MGLLVETLFLRPYVFGFVALFVLAGVRDLGMRRTALFATCVWPLAWLAEFSSTRVGVPFGLYHYTGLTRGAEIYIGDVPLMDSVSFTFLAYASYCVARAAGAAGRAPRVTVAGLSGLVMMLLDVVIDPVALDGDRWFSGRSSTIHTAARTLASPCQISWAGSSWALLEWGCSWRSAPPRRVGMRG